MCDRHRCCCRRDHTEQDRCSGQTPSAPARAVEIGGSTRWVSLFDQTSIISTALARGFAIASAACSVRTSASYWWRRASYTAVPTAPATGAASNDTTIANTMTSASRRSVTCTSGLRQKAHISGQRRGSRVKVNTTTPPACVPHPSKAIVLPSFGSSLESKDPALAAACHRPRPGGARPRWDQRPANQGPTAPEGTANYR
jgi:hypothetical protein